jgi:hypothetical protein
MSSQTQFLLANTVKARSWFGGVASPVPEVAEALGEVIAALDKLAAVVSKTVHVAAFAQHEEPQEVRMVRAAAEKKLAEIAASDEQVSRRRANRSLQAAFIRTRRRKLQRRYTTDPTEAVTYDVVRSERGPDGKVAQRFVLGLGTLKLGGSAYGARWCRTQFVEGALRDILLTGFSPELEAKLLAEFARKVAVAAEDIEQCRSGLKTFEARGWGTADLHARLDKLAAAAGLAA